MQLIGLTKLNGNVMVRKSKGLGDSIEKLTKATGIKALVEKTVPDCGCQARQEALNNPNLLVNKIFYKEK